MNNAMETNASHISGTSTQSETASLTGFKPFGHAVADRQEKSVRQQQVE